MTNNTPDYNDNLYFATSQSPRNHLATKPQAVDLTDKWKKGELPAGCYYIEDAGIYRTVYKSERDDVLEYEHNVYIPEMEDCIIVAPVPSYDEFNTLVESEMKSHLQADNYYNQLLEIKDLLKECKDLFVLEKGFMVKCIREETLTEMITKIDEVLK